MRQTFLETVGQYSNDNKLASSLWDEIELNYSAKSRHYHNLGHLDFLLQALTEVKNSILHWDVIILAIAYHDFVYRVLKSNNEEKSAEAAALKLPQTGFPRQKIDLCVDMILATQHHQINENNDINFFTDADLAILGAETPTYQQYLQDIRKEYSVYPDVIYKPGRRKVISHFLEMENIFKTSHFFNRYERQARINLKAELDWLNA